MAISNKGNHLVMNQEIACPGRSDGRSMLTSKKYSNQHASNFMLFQWPPPIHIHILALNENLQNPLDLGKSFLEYHEKR